MSVNVHIKSDKVVANRKEQLERRKRLSVKHLEELEASAGHELVMGSHAQLDTKSM